MKRLTFGPSVQVNEVLEKRLKEFISRYDYLEDFFHFSEIVFRSDSKSPHSDPSYVKSYFSIQYYILHLIHHIFNILYNNELAMERKKAPYEMKLVVNCDFNYKLLQIYIYVDNAVFGLVIGKQFIAVRELIKALFSIMANLGFEHELRFFPISKFGREEEVY